MTYTFIPIACETLGPINTKALSFLADLGRRIALVTGDPREGSFLFQRLSITVQRFNSAFSRALLPLHPRASRSSASLFYHFYKSRGNAVPTANFYNLKTF